MRNFMKLSMLLATLLLTINIGYSQNPTVSNGVATYHSNKNIGRKFQVPASWDKIVIKKNVTLTGSFYMPTRNHPIEIMGESRTTSIIKGDGSRPTDDGIRGRSYSAIRCDKSPDLYVHDLRITRPMKFHIHGGFGNVTVERCDIIAGSHTATTDGIHGGKGKTVVKDCYIDVYDDATYTIECKLIENTTFVHNKNGSPFMVSWGAGVPANHVCVIRNCTVIDNYDGTDYNHGTIGWAGKNSSSAQTMHIKFEGTFTRKVNPGKKSSPMYTIGRPYTSGISNATIEIDGLCPSKNSVDIRGNTNSKVVFKNCDSDPGNGNCPTPGGTTVTKTDATCGSNDGEIKFSFADDAGRTGISFSIDGGVNYTKVNDNTGSYTFSGLAEGTYQCYVQWGNGDCTTNLGSKTISCSGGGSGCPTPGNTTVTKTDATCGSSDGKITFSFTNDAGRTNISFSIDGGATYTKVGDDIGSYTFTGLAEGTYNCYVEWGNGDCPTNLGNKTISCSGGSNSGPIANGTYFLKIRHSNKYVEVANSSTSNRGNIQQNQGQSGANKKWDVTNVSGEWYKIINVNSGKALDVSGVSLDNGANIHQWTYSGNNNQLWKFVSKASGWYQIISKHSGKALDVAGGVNATQNGANIQQWAPHNNNNQQFQLVATSKSVTGNTSSEITMYPNPAKDRLHIENLYAGALISIFDLQGKTVASVIAEGESVVVNVADLNSGIYFVKTSQESNSKVTKLIVE